MARESISHSVISYATGISRAHFHTASLNERWRPEIDRCPKYPKFCRLSKNACVFDHCNITRERNSALKRCLIYLAKLSVTRKMKHIDLYCRVTFSLSISTLMNLRREEQTSLRTSLMLLCHFTKMERSREMKSVFSFVTLAE